MTNDPFGFSLPEPPDDENDPGSTGGSSQPGEDPNPFAMLGLPNMGEGNFDIGQALQQLGQMLSWQGGPVNWDLARQTARQVVAEAGDASLGDSERRAVTEAVRLADIWLDEACDFPSNTVSIDSWGRSQWIEGTAEGWQALVEPVAEQVVGAMERAIPAEAAAMAGPLMGILRQVGMSMWGAQVGQGLGQLSGEVVGVMDIGFPLREPGHVTLLPRNIAAFGEGLSVPQQDVLLYVALREVSRHRLFGQARWLRAHLVDLVAAFGRGINIDTSGLESAMRDIDPSNPEALQQAFEGGLFEPATTPEQEAALKRLETALALIEGWVDDVVTLAAGGRMPAAGALREAVRRRRATGGPAEQTFATLVGLQMRPRRMRDASALFAAVREQQGPAGREGVWRHPDLMPGADDLDDPAGFASGGTSGADISIDELTDGDDEPA